MAKFNIEEGSILTEVKNYELDRGPGNGRLIISVHKLIAGSDEPNLFMAVPNLVVKSAKDEYIANGKSEEEALMKCLDLIKGIPTNQIVSKN